MLRVISALLVLLIAAPPAVAARVVLPERAPSLFDRLSPGVKLSKPRVRIGLSIREERVLIGVSRGSLKLFDGISGAVLWPERAPGDLLVVPQGGPEAKVEKVYRVQVGSFRDESGAIALARRLEREFGEPAEAAWQASRGVWRVRVGKAETRNELAPLSDQLRRGGFPDAWISSEPSRKYPGGGLRLLDSRWFGHTAGRSVVFVPGPKARLTVDGRSYRGLVEVLLSEYGELVVVNEIPLEEYLRGVVPEELGPGAFPEIEALKAQAVAARTYVLGNLGQFEEQGYDICDTPRCQVYGGAGSEHPLSDRAVRETRGRILVQDSRPINAMYTSTCGGHTEDVELVFPDLVAPYLRGVRCAANPEALSRMKIGVSGRRVRASGREYLAEAPELLDLAALVARGVVPQEAFRPGWLASPVQMEEMKAWLGALAQETGKTLPEPPSGVPRRLTLWLWWWDFLGLGEAGSSLVGPRDEDLVLLGSDKDQVPADAQLRVATLMAMGLVGPGPDGRLQAAEIPQRAEILRSLAAMAARYDAFSLRAGKVRGDSRGRGVRLQEGRLERRLRVDSSAPPILLAESPAGWSLLPELELLAGDRVRFLSDAAGKLQLLALRVRRGITDDRFSSRYRWTKRRSRKELERSLGSVAPVGRLLDLRILGRGRSGRVAAILVKGTASEAEVKGFRLRRALNLPETLFDMEIQRDLAGRLAQVVFSGRGWGHGVGLCQYGAYGMALRGSSYKEILHHYYTGVDLVRTP